ncbi:hypothetical protein EVG20_g8131, partial [Dentipellis fragilis]
PGGLFGGWTATGTGLVKEVEGENAQFAMGAEPQIISGEKHGPKGRLAKPLAEQVGVDTEDVASKAGDTAQQAKEGVKRGVQKVRSFKSMVEQKKEEEEARSAFSDFAGILVRIITSSLHRREAASRDRLVPTVQSLIPEMLDQAAFRGTKTSDFRAGIRDTTRTTRECYSGSNLRAGPGTHAFIPSALDTSSERANGTQDDGKFTLHERGTSMPAQEHTRYMRRWSSSLWPLIECARDMAGWSAAGVEKELHKMDWVSSSHGSRGTGWGRASRSIEDAAAKLEVTCRSVAGGLTTQPKVVMACSEDVQQVIHAVSEDSDFPLASRPSCLEADVFEAPSVPSTSQVSSIAGDLAAWYHQAQAIQAAKRRAGSVEIRDKKMVGNAEKKKDKSTVDMAVVVGI